MNLGTYRAYLRLPKAGFAINFMPDNLNVVGINVKNDDDNDGDAAVKYSFTQKLAINN